MLAEITPKAAIRSIARYDHPSALELANRLRVYLELHEHEFSQDTREGWDGKIWEEQTADNILNWRIWIVFLSPHAVCNESNPFVPHNAKSACLNGMTFASVASPESRLRHGQFRRCWVKAIIR